MRADSRLGRVRTSGVPPDRPPDPLVGRTLSSPGSTPRWRPAAASRSRASRASASRGCSPSCARARAHGHVVLSGAAAEFERDQPYGVWIEALDAYVA